MKYFSTFSGIGGFELGINQAYDNRPNLRDRIKDISGDVPDSEEREERSACVGYSEIDKYAIKVYEKQFPNHKNYGDITTINAEELPDFDLLVGGFPCQSFSIAGKRGGFEDTRGTMFFELARILRTKQPRLFIFENVKGLLSHDNGFTFKTIIETLDELGYDLQWQVLNSKNFGVPQNRERVFIIGHLRGTARPEVFPIGSSHKEDNGVSRHITNTLTARYEAAQATGSYIGQGELDAQEIYQLNNPTHSNNRVYDPTGISPTLNTMQGGNRQPKIYDDYNSKWRKDNITGTLTLNVGAKAERNGMKVLIPEATKKGYAEATEGDSINLSVPNSKTRRGRVGRGVAQTLDTGMQQHTMQNSKIRRLTPLECERLQGFPDGWTLLGFGDEPISDSQRYKMCGNAVTVNVVQAIMERLV